MRCQRRDPVRHVRFRPSYALAVSSLAACSFNFFLINSTLSQNAPAFCALICVGFWSAKTPLPILRSKGTALQETYLHSYRHILAIIAFDGRE